MLMCILYIKRCSIFFFDIQALFFYNFMKEIDSLLKSYEQEVLMTKEESVRYIANVALISAVDGKLSPLEAQAIESIRQEIGVDESGLHQALTVVAQGNYRLSPVGRFSDQVRNLEDMILVSLADGDFAKEEKSEVLSFAKSIKINQDQLSQIVSEVKNRIKLQKAKITCDACRREIPPNSKFCPKCGAKM